jgi:hypothetical protein
LAYLIESEVKDTRKRNEKVLSAPAIQTHVQKNSNSASAGTTNQCRLGLKVAKPENFQPRVYLQQEIISG